MLTCHSSGPPSPPSPFQLPDVPGFSPTARPSSFCDDTFVAWHWLPATSWALRQCGFCELLSSKCKNRQRGRPDERSILNCVKKLWCWCWLFCSELTRSRGFTYIPPPLPLLANTCVCAIYGQVWPSWRESVEQYVWDEDYTHIS